MPEQQNLGYSPEMLDDLVKKYGGVEQLMAAVQSARANEQSAPAELKNLSPEDRAAIDRYTTFAKMREQSSGLDVPINYLGGMANMALTEGLKASPTLQGVASDAYRVYKGTPNAPDFFGGEDTSKPNLANLVASHYGYTGEQKKPAALVPPAPTPSPGYGLQGAKIESAQPNGIMDMIRKLIAGSQ